MNDFEKKSREAKSFRAKEDFNLLLQYGSVAFYKSCEVIQAFIFNSQNKEVINYYTLFCFSETAELDEKPILLGSIKLDGCYKIGCQRKRVSIHCARKCFDEIQEGALNYDESCLISKKMVLLSKVLIPQLSAKSILLREIIKPNYWGDSYIIEFYDENKDLLKKLNLSNVVVEKINKFIKEKINIDLSMPYDRVGNIIFQFPITVICANTTSKKNSVAHFFSLTSHPLITQNIPYYIQMFSRFDDTVTGFDCIEEKGPLIYREISPGDDNNLNTVVVNKDNSLLLLNSEVNFIKSINIAGRIGTQYSEPRFIRDRFGCVSNIELFGATNLSSIGNSNNDYYSQILKRNINSKVILQSGDCAVFKQNQRKKALDFIRQKIVNLSDIRELCLWDPYLTAFDIMETLYFENTGIPFRCITEFKKVKEIEKKEDELKKSLTFEDFCKQQQSCFKNNSNNLRVKMKFLAQHDIYGWDFHDRFLILVPQNISDLPIVYSLGISVNQLGNSHHTIQKVPDPRKILHNFDELWNLLDNGKCLVAEF